METMQRTKSSQVRIQESTFSGKRKIDIREYYQKEDGEYAPTKKGISFTPDAFEAFIDMILTFSKTLGYENEAPQMEVENDGA